MITIFRLDTDNIEKIEFFRKNLEQSSDSTIIIPQGEMVKMWVVNDKGNIQEVK